MKHILLCAIAAANWLGANESGSSVLIEQMTNLIQTQNYQMMDAKDLKNLGSEENDIDLTQFTSPQLIIKCSQGSTFPLNFSIHGESLSLAKTPCELKINKDLYLAFFEEELLISSDLQNWDTLGDFWSGSCSFGVTIDDGNLITDFDLTFDQ